MYFHGEHRTRITLILLGIAITAAAQKEKVVKPCRSGNVVADPWNCRYYFHCTNGKLHRYFCGLKAVFDSSLGACVTNRKAYGCLRKPFQKRTPKGKEMASRPMDEFSCSEPGFFPHSKSCKLFYRCTQSKKLMFSCPNGLLFDRNGGRCDVPENVPPCAADDLARAGGYTGSGRADTNRKFSREVDVHVPEVTRPPTDDKLEVEPLGFEESREDVWNRASKFLRALTPSVDQKYGPARADISSIPAPIHKNEEKQQGNWPMQDNINSKRMGSRGSTKEADWSASAPAPDSPLYREGKPHKPRKLQDIDVTIPIDSKETLDSLGNINIYLSLPNYSGDGKVHASVSRSGQNPNNSLSPPPEQYHQQQPQQQHPQQQAYHQQQQEQRRQELLQEQRQQLEQHQRQEELHQQQQEQRRQELHQQQKQLEQQQRQQELQQRQEQGAQWAYSTGNVVGHLPALHDPDGLMGKEVTFDSSSDSSHITQVEEESLDEGQSAKYGDIIEADTRLKRRRPSAPEAPSPSDPWTHRREYPLPQEQVVGGNDPALGHIYADTTVKPDTSTPKLFTHPADREPPRRDAHAQQPREGRNSHLAGGRSPFVHPTLPPIQVTERPVYTDAVVGRPRFHPLPFELPQPPTTTEPLPSISSTGLPSTYQPGSQSYTPEKKNFKTRGVVVIDGKEECKVAGVHVDPHDCTRFYQCARPYGTPYNVKCNGGLVFSRAEGICDWPYKVNECKGKVPRLLPRRMLSLISEKKVRRTNAKIMYPTEGDAFEPYMSGENLNMADSQEGRAEPAPKCIPESYRRDPADCQMFYICDVKSAEHVFLCPPGLAFDDDTGVCVGKEKVTSCLAPPTPAERHLLESRYMNDVEGFECPHSQDLFPHKKDCRKFYDCDEYSYANILFCPEGFVFNPLDKYCDFPQNVPQCDIKTGNFKESSNEEQSQKPWSVEGKESYAFGLPPHMYKYNFDDADPGASPSREAITHPRRQRAEPERSWIMIPEHAVKVDPAQDEGPAPLNFICRGPGRYSHPFDCDKFFVCGSGRPELGRCPPQLVFDSLLMTCAHNSKQRCQRDAEDTDPARLKGKSGSSADDSADEPLEFPPNSAIRGFICPNNGLYPDQVDCRKFYHCYNGIVEPYYCAHGEAFSVRNFNCVPYEKVQHCDQRKMTTIRDALRVKQTRLDEALQTMGVKTDRQTIVDQARENEMGGKESPVSYDYNDQSIHPSGSSIMKANLIIEDDESSNTNAKFQDVHTRSTGMTCEKEAIYLDPRDCRKFYHCYQQKLYQNVCPTGMLFDRKKYLCDDYRRVVDCRGNIRISGVQRN